MREDVLEMKELRQEDESTISETMEEGAKKKSSGRLLRFFVWLGVIIALVLVGVFVWQSFLHNNVDKEGWERFFDLTPNNDDFISDEQFVLDATLNWYNQFTRKSASTFSNIPTEVLCRDLGVDDNTGLKAYYENLYKPVFDEKRVNGHGELLRVIHDLKKLREELSSLGYDKEITRALLWKEDHFSNGGTLSEQLLILTIDSETYAFPCTQSILDLLDSIRE